MLQIRYIILFAILNKIIEHSRVHFFVNNCNHLFFLVVNKQVLAFPDVFRFYFNALNVSYIIILIVILFSKLY